MSDMPSHSITSMIPRVAVSIEVQVSFKAIQTQVSDIPAIYPQHFFQAAILGCAFHCQKEESDDDDHVINDSGCEIADSDITDFELDQAPVSLSVGYHGLDEGTEQSQLDQGLWKDCRP
jgi:hypothetical protein